MGEQWCLKEIVHAGKYQIGRGQWQLLLLLKREGGFFWFLKEGDALAPTEIGAEQIADAICRARLHWKERSFRTFDCGKRLTCVGKDRDDVGTPALFSEMARSYAMGTGIYADEEAGCRYKVNDASAEALQLLQELK
ncbi:MAG: hypothetical protein KDK40_02480 [Chlamydiia bacterium]|nr:hypothetical protein [Chlamydiia bacterium]